MAFHQAPSIVTRDLVLSYDMANTKSYQGPATTNLLEGSGMSIYNNVPGDVTAALTATTEQYRGATVWKETLTPTTASGVSYLTAGNNPGIGVVTGGGGGLANRYTGHSIFFKPVFPTHSAPIYTHYSNIAGWQSSTNYESMGDGWYRAHVIWYDTVTRSDGKYWAINPLSATLNTPIVCYWAGPFKEDSNRSTFVSRFAPINRTSSQVILDQAGNYLISPTSITYDSNSQFQFNGSSDYISLPSDITFKTTGGHTVENWFKLDVVNSGSLYNFIGASSIDYHSWYWCVYQSTLAIWNRTPGAWFYGSTTIQPNTWYQAVMVTNPAGTGIQFYLNGKAEGGTHASYSFNASQSGLKIGWFGRGDSPNGRYFDGLMPVSRVYNRALTASEVLQNFNALRGRYGI